MGEKREDEEEEKYDTNFGFSQISLSASLAFFAYDKFPVAVDINFNSLPFFIPSVNINDFWETQAQTNAKLTLACSFPDGNVSQCCVE